MNLGVIPGIGDFTPREDEIFEIWELKIIVDKIILLLQEKISQTDNFVKSYVKTKF